MPHHMSCSPLLVSLVDQDHVCTLQTSGEASVHHSKVRIRNGQETTHQREYAISIADCHYLVFYLLLHGVEVLMR